MPDAIGLLSTLFPPHPAELSLTADHLQGLFLNAFQPGNLLSTLTLTGSLALGSAPLSARELSDTVTELAQNDRVMQSLLEATPDLEQQLQERLQRDLSGFSGTAEERHQRAGQIARRLMVCPWFAAFFRAPNFQIFELMHHETGLLKSLQDKPQACHSFARSRFRSHLWAGASATQRDGLSRFRCDVIEGARKSPSAFTPPSSPADYWPLIMQGYMQSGHNPLHYIKAHSTRKSALTERCRTALEFMESLLALGPEVAPFAYKSVVYTTDDAVRMELGQ
ncbi:hypothetical protein [Kiloniella sp. b19]|uniref:hypothetical protein n=1 Tax=Kiloniella sp. GXU_MW_B19 TaxID=3141326 RepID=UPI0031DBCEE6